MRRALSWRLPVLASPSPEFAVSLFKKYPPGTSLSKKHPLGIHLIYIKLLTTRPLRSRKARPTGAIDKATEPPGYVVITNTTELQRIAGRPSRACCRCFQHSPRRRDRNCAALIAALQHSQHIPDHRYTSMAVKLNRSLFRQRCEIARA